MEELIKLLDEHLNYVSHELQGERMEIYVESSRETVLCPSCGQGTSRTHSYYQRRFNDLPMQGVKVEIVINNRILFCSNAECKRKTFAEQFKCIPSNAKRSRRLTEKIIDIALDTSAIATSTILNNGIANVGKSTICNLLKKRHTSYK